MFPIYYAVMKVLVQCYWMSNIKIDLCRVFLSNFVAYSFIYLFLCH